MLSDDIETVSTVCRDYLSPSWRNAPQAQLVIERFEKGFGNRLYKCHLKDGLCEDCTVVVRILGGSVLPRDSPNRFLSETSELLIFFGIGAQNLGPKLHAVFPGGRIEEYINSRPLTLDEWLSNSAINSEIARIMGQFHLMKHPISKNPWNLRSIVDECLRKFECNKEFLQANGYLIDDIKTSIDFDFETELQFVEALLPAVNSRIIFATNDPNRSNFLLKTSPIDGRDCDPLHLVQIDYEFSSYNYRAFDIGNYFCMKYYDFGSPAQLTGHDYPCEEYRKQFIASYIDQVTASPDRPGDWDPDARDSPQHILLEADLGSFIIRLMDIAWTLGDTQVWVDMYRRQRQNNPNSTVACFSMPEYYHNRKKHFLTYHRSWLKENLNKQQLTDCLSRVQFY